MTEVIAPDLSGIARACELLDEGKVVAFPTETVYGLGADAANARAVAEIFASKGRPAFNPLISHVSSVEDAEREGIFDPACRRLAEAFWPGPLTLVLPLSPHAVSCDLARAGLNTIGLRCPDHDVGLALLSAYGRPVAGPSANRSGHVSPTTAAHVLGDLGGRIDAVIDAGATRVGIESTIVGRINGVLTLLRPGAIAIDDLEPAAGEHLVRAGKVETSPVAPGQMEQHYAPLTPVRLSATFVEPDEALLAFGNEPLPGSNRSRAVKNLSVSGDMIEAAANLYAFLRELDKVGARAIAVAALPSSGLGEAIADRLRRAAASPTFSE